MADRFGPRPLASLAEDVDPRVAVTPDRLTAATATLLPATLPLTAAPPMPNAPLPPRINTPAPAAVDLNHAPPDQLLAAAWQKLGGVSVFDQTKSVLAIIGVLAVAVVVWRLGGAKERDHEEG